MTRKVLWRGQTDYDDADDDDWVYGSLVEYYGDYSIRQPKYNYDIAVKSSTIGQLTGEKDGGGNSIFENDVLCLEEDFKPLYTVVWRRAKGAWMVINKKAGGRPFYLCDFLRINSSAVNIVGNTSEPKYIDLISEDEK